MKKLLLITLVSLLLASCARIREKKAEHHQPFKPHKAQKGHKHKPQHHH
jgi:outer membrane biogenesis lipoprotein LolB